MSACRYTYRHSVLGPRGSQGNTVHTVCPHHFHLEDLGTEALDRHFSPLLLLLLPGSSCRARSCCEPT